MTRFWCVSAPLMSHTGWGGFLKTAQVLQVLGHDVLWISGDSLRGMVENAGLPFKSIRQTGWLWPPPPAPDLTQIPPQQAVMLRYTRALDTWLSEDLVAEGTRALLDLAEEIGPPDAIITDPFLSASAFTAEALNVPMIVAGWPAQGDFEAESLFPVQRHLSTDSLQRLERLSARFGLHGENFTHGSTPSIQSPYLHICYFTRHWYAAEMDTLLPQNVFVGGKAEAARDNPPEWFTDIPQEIPLALVTLGTTFTGDLGFFSWGAQAAARAGLLPVVAIGFHPFSQAEKRSLVDALPKGTRLVNYVPFAHVLPRTKLMIHHGGMGSTHTAVVYGVPQIVVPHAADQRVQAKRVAQAKVGLHLTAHDVKQGKLIEGAKALMDYPHVHETAQALADEMAALGGAERAAQAILEILG